MVFLLVLVGTEYRRNTLKRSEAVELECSRIVAGAQTYSAKQELPPPIEFTGSAIPHEFTFIYSRTALDSAISAVPVLRCDRTIRVGQGLKMPASQQPKNPVLVGVASLVLGLIVLGIFAFWPMYQVTQHADGITIYFKGILLGAFLTMFALNLVVLKGKGIPWKRDRSVPLTRLQISATIITCIAAMAVAGGVWLFFQQHGYQLLP
jgi:hypothetical protein